MRASVARTPGTVLQRACACGGATHAGGECAECRKKRAVSPLQRSAVRSDVVGDVPGSVHEVLRSSGEPLDPATRRFMESRFEHDFSAVRVHRDDRAAASARAVNAYAYTVGHHIAFERGAFNPTNAEGIRLLSHELTHVVQQRSEPGAEHRHLVVGSRDSAAERAAEHVAQSIGRAATPHALAESAPNATLQRSGGLAGLFAGDTAGVDFSFDELQAYLAERDRTRTIEDFTDSDNKARAIVKVWRTGGGPFVLTSQRKAILIREMLSGATYDDDEDMILELLTRSYNSELTYILGAGMVRVASLESAFDYEQYDKLQQFWASRFTGGAAAVKSGKIEPHGYPVPLGVDLTWVVPSAQLELNVLGDFMDLPGMLPGGTAKWNPSCVLGILCSQDRPIVTELAKLTVKQADKIFWEDPFYDGTSWTTKRFDGGGFSNRTSKLIGVLSSDPCARVANAIVHEVRHQTQPPGTLQQREIDAYTVGEQWAINRGVPGRSELRMTVAGKQRPDPAKIRAFVLREYPISTSAAGDTVTGRDASDNTVVTRPDGSTFTRPPVAGDTFPGPMTLVNDRVIPAGTWVCPRVGP